MANNISMNRRLLLAILRASVPPSTKYQHSIATSRVRTITSTSQRLEDVPVISFGAENDAVIAPYLCGVAKQRLQPVKENKPVKKSRISKPNRTPTNAKAAPPIADKYEISDFVDRSQPVRQADPSPAQEAPAENKTKDRAAPEKSPSKRASKELAPWQSKMHSRLSPNGFKRGDRRQKGADDNLHAKESSTEQRRPKNRDPDSPRRVARREQNTLKNQTSELESSDGPPKLEKWAEQKNALKEKFSEGWNPRKKLSPDAMEGIRGLHEQDPLKYSTPVLSEQFKISPEAIRRILKSKWSSKAGEEKMEERRERWAKRHDRIWDTQAELGLRPQRKRERDVEDPEKFEKDMVRKEVLGKL